MIFLEVNGLVEDIKESLLKIYIVVSIILISAFLPTRWKSDSRALDFAITTDAKGYVVIDKELVDIPPESYVIVLDTTGVDLEKLKKELDEKEAYLGVVEFQRDYKKLLDLEKDRKIPEKFFRVHMIKKGEVEKLDLNLKSVYMRYRRAILERSIDLLWITNIPDGWKDYTIENLKREFKGHVVDRPRPHEGIPLVNWVFPSALVILVSSYSFILGALSAVSLLVNYNIGVSIASIISTIVVYVKFKNPFLRFLSILSAGLITNASLSDFFHLNQIDVYHGVKISLLALPLFVFITGIMKNHEILKDKKLIALLTIGFTVIGTYYIVRSGNFAPVSTFERKFRDFLESVFWTRPRFKEIFGYPFLFLAWRMSNPYSFILETIGSIALVSTFNTFCHIKAPIFVSLYRSILGFSIGYGIFLLGGGLRWSGSRSVRSTRRSATSKGIFERSRRSSRRRRKRRRIF